MALPPQVSGCGDNRPHGVGTYGLYGTETEEREGNGQELRHFHYSVSYPMGYSSLNTTQ